MFQKYKRACNIEHNLKYDVKTMQNLTNILQNSTEYKHLFKNNIMWLTFAYDVSDDLVKKNGLNLMEENGSPSFEVVMHRHQIALLMKIQGAIIDCQHLAALVLIMTVCFGILIWMAVSQY